MPSPPAAAATVVASRKANTIERHLTAISQAHQLAYYPVEDKLVRTVMTGIRRVKGRPNKGKNRCRRPACS